jgi:hypothetical protein
MAKHLRQGRESGRVGEWETTETGINVAQQSLCQTWKRWVVYRNLTSYRSIHARTTKAHVTAIYHNHQGQGCCSPLPLRDPWSFIEVHSRVT